MVLVGSGWLPRRCGWTAALVSGWGGGSGELGVEGGDADQVVDGGGDTEPGPVALSAAVAQLAAAGDGLDPAEGFLDPLRIRMLRA